MKTFINKTDIGTYIIENPKYATKPAIAPTITLSLVDESDKQLYLTKSQITSGAIRDIKNTNEITPK